MDELYLASLATVGTVDPTSPADAGTELAKQGPLGILSLLLVGAIVILWRKLQERDATIAALQEARVQGMQKQTEALVGATAAMNKQAETGDETNTLLRQIASEYQLRSRGR